MTLYLGNNLISGVATPTEPTRNLGQIIESIVPLTDAGLHLLDGALINGSGIYSDFVDAIADLVTDYPDLFETEANWQSAVTNYGVCGKFVYDSVANTVRLPKITGILEGTTDVTALGDLVEAGLPNITGFFTPTGLASNAYPSGAFYSNAFNVTDYGSGVRDGYGVQFGFNAALSSSIYGNSSTVQPQAIKCYYYIVIATTTKTEIQVDIDEIATDLNGKADTDLSNVNNSGTSLGAGWAFPNNTYDDLILGASGSTYTAPANGYYYINKGGTNGSQFVLIHTSTYSMCLNNMASTGSTFIFPVKKGNIITIDYTSTGTTYEFRFIYAQGSESEAS